MTSILTVNATDYLFKNHPHSRSLVFIIGVNLSYSGFHLDRIQMNLTPFPSPFPPLLFPLSFSPSPFPPLPMGEGLGVRVGEGCPQDGVRFRVYWTQLKSAI